MPLHQEPIFSRYVHLPHSAGRGKMPPEQRYVLVVEDDASMSQAIERLLRAAGFQAVTFPSAEALLESEKPPIAACLVLDVSLPGLSGFDLRLRLFESNVSPPVIYYRT